jgi:hypothetical protein
MLLRTSVAAPVAAKAAVAVGALAISAHHRILYLTHTKPLKFMTDDGSN